MESIGQVHETFEVVYLVWFLPSLDIVCMIIYKCKYILFKNKELYWIMKHTHVDHIQLETIYHLKTYTSMLLNCGCTGTQ